MILLQLFVILYNLFSWEPGNKPVVRYETRIIAEQVKPYMGTSTIYLKGRPKLEIQGAWFPHFNREMIDFVTYVYYYGLVVYHNDTSTTVTLPSSVDKALANDLDWAEWIPNIPATQTIKLEGENLKKYFTIKRFRDVYKEVPDIVVLGIPITWKEEYVTRDYENVPDTYYYIDTAPPIVTNSFYIPHVGTSNKKKDYSTGTWTNEDVIMSLSFSDGSGSGVKEYTVIVAGLPISGMSHTFTTSGILDSTITVSAKDHVANSMNSTLGNVKIDKIAPTLNTSVTVNNSEYNGGWTNQNVSVTFDPKDQVNGSDIKNYSIDGVQTESKKYIDTGMYTSSLRAEDNAGNVTIENVLIKIDKKQPETAEPDFYFIEPNNSTNNKIYNVGYSFEAKDAHSGVKTVTVSLMNTNKEKIFSTSYSSPSTDFSIEQTNSFDIKGIDRNKDNVLYLSVTTTDNVGNTQIIESKKLLLPKIIIGRVYEVDNANGKGSRIENGNIVVPVELDFVSKDSYAHIWCQRTFYIGSENNPDVMITYENVKTIFKDSTDWDSLNDIFEIKKTVISDRNIFEDKISVKTGMGHKKIKYTFYETPWFDYDKESDIYTWKETCNDSNIELMANNPGIIEWKLSAEKPYTNPDTNTNELKSTYVYLDSQGNPINSEGEPINGRKEENLKKLKIPDSGKIQISFRVKDYDMEPYTFELKQVVEMTVPEEVHSSRKLTIGIPIKGGISNGLTTGCTNTEGTVDENGYRKYETSSEGCITDDEGWISFPIPIYLSYNKPFFFLISGNEGYSKETMCKNETAALALQGVPTELGEFRLAVGSEVNYDYFGITAQPHQEFTIKIEKTEELSDIKFKWNLGNGTEEKISNEVDCIYDQKEDRVSNTSSYDICISVSKNNGDWTPIEDLIPVSIVDTQYGELYGSEVWRGEHVLLSTVYVPEGLMLTIGDYKSIENTNVLCYGDLNLTPNSGIQVMRGGTLIVDNYGKPVLFTEMQNVFIDGKGVFVAREKIKFGWGTIYLGSENGEGEAKAVIENAVIKYANSAFTLYKGANLSLTNSTLTENIKGLDIQDSQVKSVTINKSIFSSNKEGIHVCQGLVCTPQVLDCTFKKCDVGIFLSQDSKSAVSGSTFSENNRAIVISPKVKATIDNCTFTNNLLGLHVFGKAEAGISNCTLKNNSNYGIKEDREKGNESPDQFSNITFDGIILSDNFVDYYDSFNGVLTQEEIEAKIGK